MSLIELTPENRGDVPAEVTHLVEVEHGEGVAVRGPWAVGD